MEDTVLSEQLLLVNYYNKPLTRLAKVRETGGALNEEPMIHSGYCPPCVPNVLRHIF